MKYVVIIYYVLVKVGKEIESLNIKENIEADSPEEAIGIAYNIFKSEYPDDNCYIAAIIPNAI